VRKGTGRTQADARKRLKEILRDYEDGLAVEAAKYTVKQAVEDWLTASENRVRRRCRSTASSAASTSSRC
jgi:hypothetical protein